MLFRRFINARQGARLAGTSVLCVLASAALSGTALAASGWVVENGGWHYLDSSGNYVTDQFKRSGDNYFYLDSNGDMVYSSIIDDGKNFYYVNSAGAMVSNEWREVENTERFSDDEPDTWWYYLSSNGRAVRQTGSNAKVATLPTKAGNAKFIFDETGRMMSGWIGADGQMISGDEAWREGVYYSDPENGGRLAVNSWAYITAEDPDNEEREGDGYWFFFDGSGKKVTDKVNKIINGRKYRFNEYGVANYDWYNDASSSSASYYYSTEEQCWLRTGWFKAYPDPDKDPEGYDMGDEYWYYADKKGKTAASVIKNISGQRYGFDEYGKMLHGLYVLEMADDGETILDSRLIESIEDLPGSDEEVLVYYFGDSPKEGCMKTGSCTVMLDGERLAFKFEKSGTYRGSGVNGIDGGVIYVNGRRMEADPDMRYEQFEYEGENYLISSVGKIVKNRTNVKDADGYYYCTDKDGKVTYYSDERFEK